MNRETKRMLQRQGAVGADGAAAAPDRRQQVAARRTAVKRERTAPLTFLREVRGELRRVAWPTRAEVLNYSTIVLITLAVLITLIFVLDFLFAKSVLFLFETPQ
ncbi:MAG: preprotein translocase subunit SecE [Actinobacteria bacterium]|nr:preprotein translocase subunit SecE [Actinomycetota bacterium]